MKSCYLLTAILSATLLAGCAKDPANRSQVPDSEYQGLQKDVPQQNSKIAIQEYAGQLFELKAIGGSGMMEFVTGKSSEYMIELRPLVTGAILGLKLNSQSISEFNLKNSVSLNPSPYRPGVYTFRWAPDANFIERGRTYRKINLRFEVEVDPRSSDLFKSFMNQESINRLKDIPAIVNYPNTPPMVSSSSPKEIELELGPNGATTDLRFEITVTDQAMAHNLAPFVITSYSSEFANPELNLVNLKPRLLEVEVKGTGNSRTFVYELRGSDLTESHIKGISKARGGEFSYSGFSGTTGLYTERTRQFIRFKRKEGGGR